MTNIEIKTRNILDSLSNSEKKVATYFLNNMECIFSDPIATLADSCGVSQVTWIRFCKAIGFNGLKDLKKALFLELNYNNTEMTEPLSFSDIRQPQTTKEVCNTIKNSTIQSIQDTINMIDTDSLDLVVDLICSANTIRLFGVSASAIVANDFYNKLLRINKNVIFNYDTHTQLIYAANAAPNDVCILFSYSGNTPEILKALALAQNANCPTIAITKFTKSPLISTADHIISLSNLEVSHRSGAMNSRIAQLTIVDLLFTCIAHKDYNKIEKYLEKSANIHTP